jgi:hypothetical protein
MMTFLTIMFNVIIVSLLLAMIFSIFLDDKSLSTIFAFISMFCCCISVLCIIYIIVTSCK